MSPNDIGELSPEFVDRFMDWHDQVYVPRLDAYTDWLDHAAELTRARILQDYEPPCCVAATRIGLDILRYFGEHGRPQPVRLQILTPRAVAAHAYYRTHGRQLPDDEGPPGPVTIIGCDGDGSVSHEFTPADMCITHKWSGHMIIIAEAAPVLMDLSVDQFSRPDKGITITRPVVASMDTELELRRWLTEPDYGVEFTGDGPGAPTYAYAVLHQAGNWRELKDWKHGREGSRRIVADVITQLRKVPKPPPVPRFPHK